jgi:hypothetical protein
MKKGLKRLEALGVGKAQQHTRVPIKTSRVVCGECGIYIETDENSDSRLIREGHTSVSNRIAGVFK